MTNNQEIIISGSHMELTEALKTIVVQKLQRLLKHREPILRIRVELGYDHRKDSKEEYAAKGHIAVNGTNYGTSNNPEELAEEINTDIDKMLDKHQKKVLKAEFTAKGIIEMRGVDLRATETSEDLYKSIDKLIDKLERMLHERTDINLVKRKHNPKLDIAENIPKN